MERSEGAFQKKSLFKKTPIKAYYLFECSGRTEDIPGKSNNKRQAKEWEESRGCRRNTAI